MTLLPPSSLSPSPSLFPSNQVMLAQLGFKRHMYAPAGADGEMDPNVLSFLRIKCVRRL